MSIDQFGKANEKLQRLGLTENEAKAYVAVVRLGSCKVAEIQHITGLHRPEIYRIMPRLVSLKLIEETLDRPKRYRPLDLRGSVAGLTNDATRRAQTIQRESGALIAELEKLQVGDRVGVEPQVRIVTGAENIRRNFREMLASAKAEIFLMSPKAAMSSASRSDLAYFFRTLKSKNLKVKSILEVDEANYNQCKRIGSASDVRHYSPIMVYMWIVDGQNVAIGLNPTSRGSLNETSALLTSYPAYVRAIREFFDTTWRQATPLSVRIATLNQPQGLQTRVVWGREEMYKVTNDWPTRAKKRIQEIATRHGPNRILQRHGKPYADARRRGVRVQILCSMNSDNKKAVRKLSELCEVRHVDSSFGLGVAILDDSEALIHYISPDTPDLATSSMDVAVHATDRQVVQDLSHMFDFIWKRAVPIQRMRR